MSEPATHTALARSLAAREDFHAVAMALIEGGYAPGEVVADMAAALGILVSGAALPGRLAGVLDQAAAMMRETALLSVDVGGNG